MYDFTEHMQEISGFGGSYEAGCRAMVKAGMTFIDSQSDINPQFKGYKNVYGLIVEDNDDAKALTEAIMDAPFVDPETEKQTTIGEYGATGAMHQAAITHCLYIMKHGWDKYVAEMSQKEVSP